MTTLEQYEFPADPYDALRPDFETKVRVIAVEKFGYAAKDSLLKTIFERNKNGVYAIEWIRGAWEGYKINLPAVE